MRVLKAEYRRFRGFDSATITPIGHVVLVGEPGAGRSDVIEGLERVLSPDRIRGRFPSELDFFARDTKRRAEVELVIGALGRELEQVFFDMLEVWDRIDHKIVEATEDPETIDREEFEFALRLCYRATWDERQGQGEHWVDYPKSSDPEAGRFERVGRADREVLRFAALTSHDRVLELGERAVFRRFVESSAGDDFAKAVTTLEDEIETEAGAFSSSTQMEDALEEIFRPLRSPLNLSSVRAADVIRFLPEGGSIAGFMRSLSPALDLGQGVRLPLTRHGSTLLNQLRIAQALAVAGTGGILAIDDFGEGLDSVSAHYLAAVLRSSAAQCWLSTRRSHAAEAFQPAELVRLARDGDGARRVFYGRTATTKAERLAARHLNLQLLPAVGSRAVVVMEGPHDCAALRALAAKGYEELNEPLPSAKNVSLIDAGAADASGGSSALARLCQAARQLGLRTVAVLDHDGDDLQAAETLKSTLQAADVVVRLPKGHAIEMALLSGLPEAEIRAALGELNRAFAVPLPPGFVSLGGPELTEEARRLLKTQGGLHAQFVEALSPGILPAVGHAVLRTCVESAIDRAKSGHVQL
jgi:hypothetical protein